MNQAPATERQSISRLNISAAIMAEIFHIGGSAGEPPRIHPDAYGQAALMLTESLLHALIDAATFSVQDAIAIVQRAHEAKFEERKGSGRPQPQSEGSLELLKRIALSLETDLN